MQKILAEIKRELDRENRMHGEKFHSLHEGYVMLQVEVDKLWEEVTNRRINILSIRDEAAQVAAMAIKLILSCCEEETNS